MANLNLDTINRHLRVVRQNPLTCDSLLADCNYDLDEVAAVIEPLLQASKRCQISTLYVQAIVVGKHRFLATNLVPNQVAQVTPIASSWLLGRSEACAIVVAHKTVSRCHAVIGNHPNGLCITDIGSSNGTWVNRQRLLPAEPKFLQDGDVLQLGKLQVEFFLTQPKSLVMLQGTHSRWSNKFSSGKRGSL